MTDVMPWILPKIERELGWAPSVTFEQGIAKTFDWYKENADWVRELESRIEVPEFKERSKKPKETSR